MSVAEFDGMLKTGTVQAGAGGRAYSVHPSDSSSFGSQAAPGSLYVEFDVPRSSLQPATTALGPPAPDISADTGAVATPFEVIEQW
jgi:hypothetical protein